MEDVNQYLNEGHSEEEWEAAQKIKRGLLVLHIQEKVKAAAAERATLHRKRIWRWIVTAAVLVVLAGAALLFWRTPVPTALPSSAPTPETTPPTEETKSQLPTAPPAGQKNATPPGPIAQVRPDERLPNPRYAAPEVMMRGDDTTGTADDKQTLLNQLWYTNYPLDGLIAEGTFATADQLLRARDFPAAYINLQRLARQSPQNDTLRYLKAYCLLEMGQGAEALPHFEALQGHVAVWDAQLEWYRGLSLLQAGQTEAATSIFKQIAEHGRMPYRAYGKKAVRVLNN